MKKITWEECQNRIDTMFPEESITLVDYTKMSAPARYRCETCNTVHYIYKTSDLFMKKHLCNTCIIGNGEVTTQQKKKALEIIEQSELEFKEFGYNKKLLKPTIKFQCGNCHEATELALIYFLRHPYCSHCAYDSKHGTTNSIQYRIPESYTLLEPYQGTDYKHLIRHEGCGFIWKATIHSLVSGGGCPKCSKKRSKGEQKIEQYLNEHNIEYEIEKSFEQGGRRRYDFYLPKLKLVIEYHGIQHFQEVQFFEKSLTEQQVIDLEKYNLAIENGLSYFMIPYTDYGNINQILAQRLDSKYPTNEDKGIV